MSGRKEHLAWCKTRAMEYCNQGDFTNAFASMVSDLGKHEETRTHAGIGMGMLMMTGGLLNSRDEMTRFIEGFN